MRRRSAYLFFGTILLAVLAYIAWCARPLYLRPPLVIGPGVPAEVQAAVLHWKKETGGIPPEAFSFERLAELLMNPYSGRPAAIVYWDHRPKQVVIVGPSQPNAVFFSLREGNWTEVIKHR